MRGIIESFKQLFELFTTLDDRFIILLGFYPDNKVAFLLTTVIIVLLTIYLFYLQFNKTKDYLIEPFKLLIGYLLILFIVFVFSTHTKLKEIESLRKQDFLERFPGLKGSYYDEKKWLTNDSACQKLEDEKNTNYCIEIKDQCSEASLKEKYGEAKLLFEKQPYSSDPTPFETCVEEVRERLGMPPIEVKGGCDIDSKIIMDINKRYDIEPRILGSGETDIYGNTRTVEGDTKVNWGNIYNAPFTNFGSIKKRWGDMSSEQKLSIVLNVVQTCRTYDQFPDWMKNDPLIMEIKEELQKINE